MSDESLLELALETARDAARGHMEIVRRELTRPWDEGSPARGAETGRRLGLALTISALALGVGLAFYAVFAGD